MITRNRLLIIVLFIGVHSYAQKSNPTPDVKETFPGKTWEYIENPAVFGWDLEKLTKLERFIVDSANTTGLMVVQHGKVVFSYGDLVEQSYIASCRKSVLSILYGPFVENGRIPLDKTLGELGIGDYGGLLPIEKKATIRNLLTARSGVYHKANYSGDEYAIAPKRGSVTPGTLFLYNNWDFNLAGYLFEHLTGHNIYDAVDSMLARPLMMEDWKRDIQHKDNDTSQSKYPAYPMWFSTRDMARIGYLMLHKGKWQNNQLVSGQWIKTITTPVTSFEEANVYKKAYFLDGCYFRYFGYGYLWWTWGPSASGAYKGAFTAQGNVGQYITVLPALDMVVAHKTKPEYERYTINYLDILAKIVDASPFQK